MGDECTLKNSRALYWFATLPSQRLIQSDLSCECVASAQSENRKRSAARRDPSVDTLPSSIFDTVESREFIEVTLGLILFRNHPNLMQLVYRLCLQAFRKFIDHMSRLVNPETLPTGVGIYTWLSAFQNPSPPSPIAN